MQTIGVTPDKTLSIERVFYWLFTHDAHKITNHA
jgi:hypothetical protein